MSVGNASTFPVGVLHSIKAKYPYLMARAVSVSSRDGWHQGVDGHILTINYGSSERSTSYSSWNDLYQQLSKANDELNPYCNRTAAPAAWKFHHRGEV